MTRHLFIVLAISVLLVACDDKKTPDPTDNATSEAPVAETTPPVEPEKAPEPDDGAQAVPLDEETGWPEAIVADTEVIQEKRKVRRKRKRKASNVQIISGKPESTIDLFDGTKGDPMPSLSRDSSDSQKKRFERRLRKAQKVARKTAPRAKSGAEGELGLFTHLNDVQEIAEQKKERSVEPSREVEPEKPTTKNNLSTFAVDVDTGSYSLALGRMRRGYPPREENVRIEEWLNTFHYEQEVPEGETFGIAMEAAPNPFIQKDDEYLLRVNIAGKSVADDERPPAHLTFVVDVSGSMFGPEKLDLIKESLLLLVNNLRPDDTVAIVTYAKETQVVLWPTKATEKEKIRAAIGSFEAGGSTAMDDGLKLGYGLAFRESHYNEGDIHRVVVLGDGRANVGARNVSALLGPISRAVDKGITLSTIGFGAEEFNDHLMEQLANRGNGNYSFVSSYRDARRIFAEQLCGTLHVIGKDAKIQVEFKTDRVKDFQLLGYENRKLANTDFRNDDVDAGEIGAGHQVTALYRVVLAPDTTGPLATARLRWENPESGEVSEIEDTLETVTEDLRKATDDFKFAASVAATADRFGKQIISKGVNAGLIREIAGEAVSDDHPERKEFVDLLEELEPFMKKD